MRSTRTLPLEALPWAERVTYFLREVLHYSRRDCALLLGISDANVDELNRFARKRMGIPVETLHQLPHAAHETQLRRHVQRIRWHLLPSNSSGGLNASSAESIEEFLGCAKLRG